MISKGCMTATWDQPEMRWKNTCNHAVKEGKETISEGHVKINKLRLRFNIIESNLWVYIVLRNK